MPTLDELIQSADDSSPIQIFKFVCGGQEIRITSADEPQTYLGKVYTPANVGTPKIASTSDANQGTTEILLAGVQELIDWFRDEPPGEVVSLTIFNGQRDLPGEFRASWFGEIHGFEMQGNRLNLKTNSPLQSQKRLGLGDKWQKSCPYALYDPSTCKVNKGAFGVNGTVSAVSGKTITVPGLSAALDMVAGYVEFTDALTGVKNRKTVLAHSGNDLLLASVPRNLPVGAAITAYPGCDQSMGDGGCNKFSNRLNYGGVPGIPLVNLFDPNYNPF